MTSIRPFLGKQSAFEPDAVHAMSQAFEEACIALHIGAADEVRRDELAEHIVDLARSGVSDAQTLQDMVLVKKPLTGL